MDTSFRTPTGMYGFDARCEMLAELGFDACYLTCPVDASWDDASRLTEVRERWELGVAGVYVTLDAAQPGRTMARTEALLDRLGGIETTLELAVRCSDSEVAKSSPGFDATVLPLLQRLADKAHAHGLQISLYPHVNHWLERVEDGVRLAKALDHPAVRVSFCGFHWFAADGSGLRERLALVAPYLGLVNICGSRRRTDRLPTIETLDEGELDNFHLLWLLAQVGYSGPVGLQGYSVGGDVYTKLKRSLATYHDICRRIEQHPTWGTMN